MYSFKDISAYIVGSTAAPLMTEGTRSSSLIMLGEAARRECAGALACRPVAGMNAAGELMRTDNMVQVSERREEDDALSKKLDSTQECSESSEQGE